MPNIAIIPDIVDFHFTSVIHLGHFGPGSHEVVKGGQSPDPH